MMLAALLCFGAAVFHIGYADTETVLDRLRALS